MKLTDFKTKSAWTIGILAIILGAFGAHALKSQLTENQLTTFETGVRYQMYHAIFLLFLGTTSLVTEKSKKIILSLVLIGVLFFSGSIFFYVKDIHLIIKQIVQNAIICC